MTHSCEAVYKGGELTKVVDLMEEFLNYVNKFKDVKFLTLKESSKYL